MSHSNQQWSLPVNPNASLLSRLYSLLENLQDAADVLKLWPAETGEDDDQQGSEQTSSHYISTTKLINEINQTITNLKAVEMRVTEMQRVEAECVTSNEGQNSQQQGAPTIKIMSSPVPLDLLDLMDFGSSGGIGSGQGVHPEFFARCLLAEASRQLAGLRRRKNALEKLGRVIGEGIKKRKERSNSSKTGVRNMSLKRDLEEAGFDADSSSNQDKPTESLGGAKKAKLM